MPRKEYRLYRWKFTPWGLGQRPTRGILLGKYDTFRELEESAKRRARLAGYDDDMDWFYLFDWEKEVVGVVTQRPTRNQHPPASDKKLKRRKRG